MPYTTIAFVDDLSQMHAVTEDLQVAGFPASAISVVAPENDVADQGGATSPPWQAPRSYRSTRSNASAADWRQSISSSVALTPVTGHHRWRATGPILTILSGLGLRAAPNGMIRSLTGMGLPLTDATRFNAYLDEGHILIVVRTDEESCSLLVEELLRRHGGRDICHTLWPPTTQLQIDPA
jgi:hypothetical protein